tara:strand:+ start:319 stop:516 length:198 start_codon:yes stop_codon:yes gene_type:complete
MNQLKLYPNIERGDDFYEALIAAHEGLTKYESDKLNAKLILVMANQIGDIKILQKALNIAKEEAK